MSNVKTGVVIGVIVTLTLVLAIGAIVFGLGADSAVETASNAGATGVEIAVRSILGGIWNVFGAWLWWPVGLFVLWIFAWLITGG